MFGWEASGAVVTAERHPALSPEEALRSFHLEPGLRIELVAAEPQVVDPVAFVFPEPGKMLVAEGRGYPDPVQGGGSTSEGRIALLQDRDGDGQFERRTDFATGLGYVNGLALWRGGVFVTAAPDILYLKDHDGDGVADEHCVVLTGFDKSKTAQLRVSHPTLGLDGHVYVTSGLNGGRVTSPEYPKRPAVVFSLRDGRFHPDTFEFENTGGRAQFGLSFDAFGRRFICSNRHPVLQVMLEPWQLARNPYLGFSDNTQEVSKVEAEAKVFPLSRATLSADFIPRFMAAPHTGTFTSACAVAIFGGPGLSEAHVGNAFICEPAQNLVQRQVLRPAGASFRSEPADPRREFLASTDVWFRPVFLGEGPDGALYVADMYRREIDHPRYVPEESRGLLDFESGKDRGRIYRIVREGERANPARANLPKEPTLSALIADLEAAGEWWRARAQRWLVERGDRSVSAEVEKVALTSARPEARTRALWTLRALRILSPATLRVALRDPHPGVRENAIQLAAEIVGQGTENGLVAELVKAAGDADPRVRFCSALALGGISDPAVVPALAEIAARDGEDRWTRAAVLTGVAERMDAFRAALYERRARDPAAFAAMMELLARVFGAGAAPEACRRFFQSMLESDVALDGRVASVLGLVEGFRARAGVASSKADPFAAMLGSGARDDSALRAFLQLVAERASDDRAPVRERGQAVALLGYTDFTFAGERLGRLLDARQPPEVQLQAVRALERMGDPRGGARLIAKENWSRYTPQVREAVLATLTAKPALIAVLFDAIKAGTIAAPEISSVRRTQLLKHPDANVRSSAEAIFKEIEGGDRMQVYRSFRDTLAQHQDVARGRAAFLKACSACHTHQGVGGKVGPDLTGIRNQPADAILLHILVPNYEVAPNYQTLSIVTADGRSMSGWLAAETESSLTLRTSAGGEETIARASIASLVASGISLMPEGLEQTLAKEDVANLVAFLKSEP